MRPIHDRNIRRVQHVLINLRGLPEIFFKRDLPRVRENFRRVQFVGERWSRKRRRNLQSCLAESRARSERRKIPVEFNSSASIDLKLVRRFLEP